MNIIKDDTEKNEKFYYILGGFFLILDIWKNILTRDCVKLQLIKFLGINVRSAEHDFN